MQRSGRLVVKDFSRYLFYLEPKDKPGYIRRKLAALDDGKYLFCCFNSLEKAPENGRRMVLEKIEGILR